LSAALVESIALLQSYLIKMIMITTNTIVTITALIPPAIGPIFLGSDVGSITTINIKYILSEVKQAVLPL
jgi:hypothetical protein